MRIHYMTLTSPDGIVWSNALGEAVTAVTFEGLGYSGWELVTIYQDANDLYRAVFKRVNVVDAFATAGVRYAG